MAWDKVEKVLFSPTVCYRPIRVCQEVGNSLAFSNTSISFDYKDVAEKANSGVRIYANLSSMLQGYLPKYFKKSKNGRC